MNTARKRKGLECIFSFFEEWSRAYPLACRKGCSSCCTRSVTITGLEGRVLREHLEREGRSGLLAELPALAAGDARPELTTNQFAAACLEGIEAAGEEQGWNFAPARSSPITPAPSIPPGPSAAGPLFLWSAAPGTTRPMSLPSC
jgi:hypothetical protein